MPLTAGNNLLQTAEGHCTTDITTTSASLVDIAGATVTITTQASTKVKIDCSVAASASQGAITAQTITVVLVIDGTADYGSLVTVAGGGGGAFCVSRLILGLSAGSPHTFKLQWATSAGATTARIRASSLPTQEHASIVVLETRV